MSTLREKVQQFQRNLDGVLAECERQAFATRAQEFQQQAMDSLQEVAAKAITLKEEAVAAQDEDVSNALLSIEYMAQALFGELGMWVALKKDDASKAWNSLVVAQGATRVALRSHRVASNLVKYAEKLQLLEDLLFPPQVFVSSSMVLKSSECSICGLEYGECKHIVGRVYMGEMCSRVNRKIGDLKHVAIVREPNDKRCRATHREYDGKRRDTLTWRIVPDDSAEKHDPPEPGHSRWSCTLLFTDGEPGR